MKPYAESCDENRGPILEVIGPLFADASGILEIGSGTGQHAVYFAQRMPHLIWYTSDRAENHAGIGQWLEEAALSNTRPPLVLDVAQDAWPSIEVDAVFSANTAHIMAWSEVQGMFRGVGHLLTQGGLFALYGPFSYRGRHTSESNARFDAWLKARDPRSGIRNFEDLDALAEQSNMTLLEDYEMPVNNRILCWRKGKSPRMSL